MRQNVSFLIIFALLLSALAGCGSSAAAPEGPGASAANPAAEENQFRVVVTVFPIYDWVKTIAGDDPHVSLRLLVDNGVDLHSFQPTAEDILEIANCDVFLYIGGESDDWVAEALRSTENPNRQALRLMDALDGALLEEETVEGMEAEEEEEEEDEEPELDEHVWLSIRNAAACCQAISQVLAAMDPEHAAEYAARTAEYCDALTALDGDFQAAVDEAPYHTLLFADRFPFRYMTEEYGLDYYAAFSGCSAETEASFETVAFLAKKLDELGLPAVLTIEGSDRRLAETVVNSSQAKNQKILTINSMQGVSPQEIEAGGSYLGYMTENLEILKEALGLEAG